MGYWGEQNGQSVLPVVGYHLLQNENRIVRVGGFDSLPRYAFPLFLTLTYDFVRFRTIDGGPQAAHGLRAPCHERLSQMNGYGIVACGAHSDGPARLRRAIC
jgi:hypothetical protein